MPTWAVITLVAGIIVLVTAIAAGVWLAWRAYERRVLLRLVGRLEAVEATAQVLVDSIGRLSESADDELEAFASDPDATERRVLAEVRGRARILQEELDHMSLPRRLVPVAEALADASFVIVREASRISDDDIGEPALDALSAIDLGEVAAYVTQSRTRLRTMCAVCGVEDTVVYGGGLYL